jgi:hypothetical protein
MTTKKIEMLNLKIEAIKKDLVHIGNMRPGSVTEQFKKRGEKKWAYWQISYTQNKRSKTEYLKDEFVEQIKNEVLEYKKFKLLMEKLVEMNISLSKEKIKLLRKNSES